MRFRKLSSLPLPEIEHLADEVARVVPAGNVPAMILTGLANVKGRRVSVGESRKHIDLLFRGVRHSLDEVVYAAFFAGPAAVLYAYQQLLRLAGKDLDAAFPDGTWQFYLEFALREDSARRARRFPRWVTLVVLIAVVALIAVIVLPSAPSMIGSSAPTPAPGFWLPVEFVYDADAFYWVSQSDRRITVGPIVFERVGGPDRFEGRRWIYQTLEPYTCMEIVFIDVEEPARPGGCRSSATFVLARGETKAFWTGEGQFRVLWDGQTIAACDIVAGRCQAAVPPN